MFRLLFILAPIFLVFFSCQKEDQPDAPGNRLKMISTKEGDSISFRSFQYDDQNRLITILDSNNNGYKWHRLISYDWQGKLETVTEEGETFLRLTLMIREELYANGVFMRDNNQPLYEVLMLMIMTEE